MGIGFYKATNVLNVVTCFSAYCAHPCCHTDLALSGGGGVEVLRLGPAIGFVEARYVTIRPTDVPTNLFPVTLGFVFGAR